MCGWKHRQPCSPKVTQIHSGVYFHFLLPSGARALRFCLLLKNPAPTLGLNPQCARGFVESLLILLLNPKEGRGQFSKAGRGEKWSVQTSKCFRERGAGSAFLLEGCRRNGLHATERWLICLSRQRQTRRAYRIPVFPLGVCSTPNVLLFLIFFYPSH